MTLRCATAVAYLLQATSSSTSPQKKAWFADAHLLCGADISEWRHKRDVHEHRRAELGGQRRKRVRRVRPRQWSLALAPHAERRHEQQQGAPLHHCWLQHQLRGEGHVRRAQQHCGSHVVPEDRRHHQALHGPHGARVWGCRRRGDAVFQAGQALPPAAQDIMAAAGAR
jgi:hypothetical protein